MKNKKDLEINKWNVYLANVPFLEIKGQKARPVIVIAKVDIAVFIVPLTTNLDKANKYDIPIKLNNQKGLIKVESLQRIYIKNFIKPLYSIKTKKRIRIDLDIRKQILIKLKELLINEKIDIKKDQ